MKNILEYVVTSILFILFLVFIYCAVSFGLFLRDYDCSHYEKNGPLPEYTNKLMSNLKPKHDKVIVELKKLSQEENFSPVYSSTVLEKNLATMRDKQISIRLFETLLKENIEAVRKDFMHASDMFNKKQITFECYEKFYNEICVPIYQDSYLYRIDEHLHETNYAYDTHYNSNFVNKMKELDQEFAYIEKYIERFGDSYNGYFDKNGFLSLINKIRNSKNYNEFSSKIQNLSSATCAARQAYSNEEYEDWSYIENQLEEILMDMRESRIN